MPDQRAEDSGFEDACPAGTPGVAWVYATCDDPFNGKPVTNLRVLPYKLPGPGHPPVRVTRDSPSVLVR